MQDLFTTERLQELQRFAELGRMSAVLLHEISNPLTAALLNLEASDHNSLAIRRARRDMHVMKRYVEAARSQVRGQSQVTVFGVQAQLDQLTRLITPLARKAGVRLKITAPAGCRLQGDPVKFQQIIINLVKNAMDAYEDAAANDKLVEVVLAARTGWLTIQVSDRATGIAAEALPRLFEEFYTTKATPASGLGMGLAIVKQYATEDFHGTVRVHSGRNGTKFTLTMPLFSQ